MQDHESGVAGADITACSGQKFDAMCQEELSLSTACLLKNPKSYPSWHHRCWSVQTMFQPNYEKEIELCNSALLRDSRNFHCWNYRRFLFRCANMDIQREIDFTETKIRENFSNFSSWYMRSTLLTEAAALKLLDVRDLWDKEYQSVENAIFTDPSDQSAWFYHKWLSSIDLGASVIAPAMSNTSITVKQIVWNKIRNFLVVRFSCARACCPPLVIKLHEDEKRSPDLVPLTSIHLQSAFVLKDVKAVETVNVQFNVSNFAIGAKEDIIVRNAPSSSYQRKRILRDENVANLIELQELEPENKWTNLALTFFGRDRITTLQKMCEIDSCRTNYYRDQASDILTGQLLLQSGSSCSMEFKFHELSRVSHLDQMVHVRFLDLSGNHLDILPRSFNQLYSLETLILSDNRISAISRGLALLSLRKLALMRNRIASVQVLDRLGGCLNLDVVYLYGNPFTATVRDHLSEVWNCDEAAPNLQSCEGSVSIGPLETAAEA